VTKTMLKIRTLSDEGAEAVTRRVAYALDNYGYVSVGNAFAGAITASTENINDQAVVEKIASDFVVIERIEAVCYHGLYATLPDATR
jgi:hypothetical protein